MARTYAKLKGGIWRDADWCQLDARHQRLYLLLVSQPEMTNCGVVTYLPAKWARMASDTTEADILNLLAGLEQLRYIIADADTFELLVRTFVKHDQVLEQPKIQASAQRQYDDIQSHRIRTVLAAEYPTAFQLRPGEQPYPEPYGKPSDTPDQPKGMPNPTDTPLRERAGDQPPTITSPTTSNSNLQQQPRETRTLAADVTDLELIGERLKTAGWNSRQLDQAASDPLRAIAWLEHAENRIDVRNPGAVAWRSFEAGAWPPGERAGTAEPRAVDPSAPCPGCGAKIGAGHLDDCPDVAAAVGAVAVDAEPVESEEEREERLASMVTGAAGLLRSLRPEPPTEEAA